MNHWCQRQNKRRHLIPVMKAGCSIFENICTALLIRTTQLESQHLWSALHLLFITWEVNVVEPIAIT